MQLTACWYFAVNFGNIGSQMPKTILSVTRVIFTIVRLRNRFFGVPVYSLLLPSCEEFDCCCKLLVIIH